jgi:hypothetical protein
MFPSKKAIQLLTAALLLATTSAPTFAQGSSDQQEKDFEQKQRIYGTKHPWENTAPYGTQYTPPQAGAGSPADSDTSSDKPAEPTKPAKKPATKKSNKQKKAAQKKAASKGKTTKAKP